MSTAFALGAVSAVLRQRLSASFSAAGLAAAVGGVTITVTSPDRVPVGAQEANRVNLYLHRVSRNQAWANLGPPPRAGDGSLVSQLPVGLNVHYVISAYGQDPFTTDILLGHVVAALSDEPVLTRAAIRHALSPNPPDPSLPAVFGDSRLADQLESITITPVTAGMEEISRLWSAFGAPLRPSVFYDVTTVLIESRQAATTPFPAVAVGSAAVATSGPLVDAVIADGPLGTPIATGSTIIVTGRSFAGDGVAVRVGSSVATPTTLRDRELRIPVAAFAPPLRAGLAGLVVTQEVALGDPPVIHSVLSSHPVPVIVAPTLSFGNGAVNGGAQVVVDGVTLASGSITAGASPRVGRDQQASLVLTEVGAPPERPARGVVLAAPASNGAAAGVETVNSISFAYQRVPKGTYIARLRVDGIDSALHRAPDGRFDGPAVTL